jgi:hypothetical protein
MGRESIVQRSVDDKSGRRWKAERSMLMWLRCAENDFQTRGLDDGRTKVWDREVEKPTCCMHMCNKEV